MNALNQTKKILVVEDDAAQRNLYTHLFKNLKYENIYFASNSAEAIELFNSKKPDLAIIDINLMEDKTGIDVAKEFNAINKIPIIFITGSYFDEIYEKAKLVNPVAFLDKDLSELKLKQSIELGINKYSVPEQENKSDKLPEFFFVRVASGQKKIVTNEIDWVEVDGKYCCLHSNGKKYPIRISLKELQEKLPSEHFVRVHQSYSVNIKQVTGYNSNDNIIKVLEKEIPIGRFYKKELTSILYQM